MNWILAYINKFENLSYEKFKQMAVDPSLQPHEKVGFPDEYRKGKEPLIWRDIRSKLTNLSPSPEAHTRHGHRLQPLATTFNRSST